MQTTDTVLGTPSTMGDDEQLTTTRLLRDAARTFGDQQIIHTRGGGSPWQTTTYAAVWERVRRMAAALRAEGVGPGDRVGLLLWNDVRHLESYFSVPLLGATMVQLNLRLAPTDLAYVITHAQVGTIVVDETLLELAAALEPHLPGGVRWIVDPIDGTVNFLYGIPAYGVSVACEVDGRIVAGAVADVAGGRVFHAGLGAGAVVRTVDGREETLRCSAPDELGVSLVATGFGYDSTRRATQGRLVADLLGDVRDIRRIGSAALDLCLLAAGAVDCYFEHGLNLWDWAAGALIAGEAGAVVKLPDPEAASADGELVAASAPTVAEEFFGALDARGALGPISRCGR